MTLAEQVYEQPSVYVTEADYDRLAKLVKAAGTFGARLLAEELDRAVIIGEADFPRGFVRLNHRVEFTDLMTGRTRQVEVVPPEQADIDQARLSVLSPVGAALIGLAAGATINLSTEDGRRHILLVDSVEPEHA